MANSTYYKYVNEKSINSELICVICNNAFNDPMCTSCDHTYCRDCIVGWINGRNLSCPICREHLKSVDHLVRASRTIRNMLDALPVECNLCCKTGIERGSFNEHMSRECRKIEVSCPSADIKCPWKGTRDELNNHLRTCLFHPFRAIVTELMAKNQQLEEQVRQLSSE